MQEGRLSRKCIEADLDESLRTLGIDHIDLYWLHRDDLARPVEDIMETLATIVRSGKVRMIGSSNWQSKRIEEANNYAKQNNLPEFVSSQIQWSLATSTPEAHNDPTIICMDNSEYDWYLKNNFPVMAYSSQAKGFFAKASSLGLEGINQKALSRFCTPENIERLERVKKYSLETGISISGIVLGYITSNPLPSTAILGCKDLNQLKDSLTAKNIILPSDVVKWLFEGM